MTSPSVMTITVTNCGTLRESSKMQVEAVVVVVVVSDRTIKLAVRETTAVSGCQRHDKGLIRSSTSHTELYVQISGAGNPQIVSIIRGLHLDVLQINY